MFTISSFLIGLLTIRIGVTNHIRITTVIHETDCGINRSTDVPGLPNMRRFVVDVLDNLIRVTINHLQMMHHSHGQQNERLPRADDVQFAQNRDEAFREEDRLDGANEIHISFQVGAMGLQLEHRSVIERTIRPLQSQIRAFLADVVIFIFCAPISVIS